MVKTALLAVSALLTAGKPDAGTVPQSPECSAVRLEYINHTIAPVRFLSHYRVDGTPHAAQEGQEVAPGGVAIVAVPHCITPKTQFRLYVEAFGIGGEQESSFVGSIGKKVRCRAVVEAKSLSVSCRPE